MDLQEASRGVKQLLKCSDVFALGRVWILGDVKFAGGRDNGVLWG